MKAGSVESATVEGRTIKWVSADKKRFVTYSPGDIGWSVTRRVRRQGRGEARGGAKPRRSSSPWFPMLLLIGVWIFFMRQMQGGYAAARSRPARVKQNPRRVEQHGDLCRRRRLRRAKEEVAEIVEFLRDPSKFQKLAGRIPRGVRWCARVPQDAAREGDRRRSEGAFLLNLGLDFVEMLSASAPRVRDMFEQAK